MNNAVSDLHDSIAILLANRSFLYRLLQRVFGDEPNKELLEIIVADHTAEALHLILEDNEEFSSYYDLLTRITQDMQESAAETIDRLKSEYTYLMIGPGELPAPPWESVYITKEPLIFQESTLKVRQFYVEHGFIPAKYPNEADDHIALELDFMAHMSSFAAEQFETEDFNAVKQSLQDQKLFLTKHLLVWVGDFATSMQKSKSHYFYPLMAKLVEEILTTDLAIIEEILDSNIW